MLNIKRFIKIFLLLVLAIITSVGIWQRKNIKAVYTAFVSNPETIASNMEKQVQEHKEVLKEYDVNISVPTIEQTDKLLDGTLTAEEVKSSLGLTKIDVDNFQDINSEKTQNNTNESITSYNSDEDTINSIVNNCVSELYAYRVDLMAQLGQLKQEALNEWNSLPKEYRTEGKMRDIGMAGLNKCYALESVADAKVKSILNKYKVSLSNIGADTSIIDTLWDQYSSEKESQKAYYINKYMN